MLEELLGILNKSSPRRRPGFSWLVFMGSGLRRNDESGLVQRLLRYQASFLNRLKLPLYMEQSVLSIPG